MPIRLISWVVALAVYMIAIMSIAIVLIFVGRLANFNLSEGVAITSGLIFGLFLSAWATNRLFDFVNVCLPLKWRLSFDGNRPEWSAWESGWRLKLWSTLIIAIFGLILYATVKYWGQSE